MTDWIFGFTDGQTTQYEEFSNMDKQQAYEMAESFAKILDKSYHFVEWRNYDGEWS